MADAQVLRIYIEAPTGDRFEADIPCLTKVGQVAGDFFESMGWPTSDRHGRGQKAVVELVDPRNPDNTMRLSSDRGVCESGLREGDTLRIRPESLNEDLSSAFDEMGMWLHESVKRRHILRSQRGLVRQVAWSPNGKLLASVSTGNTICLWQRDTGQLFRNKVLLKILGSGLLAAQQAIPDIAEAVHNVVSLLNNLHL